ncbi:hypothetical protein [Kitasatospora sp. NPDC089509]|uniref:hypothetical protein n=1 Tax=Kitasatospora sp. NPDC089509 TaxID=3364079 RepID=UPI00381CD83F
MKRRSLTRAAVLAGAALLALTAPAQSYASTGVFRYTTPDGVETELYNPTDDICYNINAYGPYRNGTNRRATFYPATNCRGNATTVRAGAGSSLLNAQSVKLVR